MRSAIISLGLAAIIGVVIVLLLQSPDTEPTAAQLTNPSPQMPLAPMASPPQDSDDEIDALRQQLQQEIAKHKKLQNTVRDLSDKVAALTMQRPATRAASGPMPGNAQGNTWFNQQALIDAGVDRTTAQDLQNRFETQELEKLYLRDRAMREGWFGSRRYRDELAQLDTQFSGLQNEIGDTAYEAFLFATRQINQVVVQSVLASSSADSVGIRANDRILSYDGQRIFNWRDLRTATTQGAANETVSIEIIRGDRRLQLYVPRGPLGVRMNSISAAP